MSLDRPSITEEFRDAVEHNATRTRETKASPPFSLRLTAEEKAELLRRAGNMPLGAYIRSQLLAKDERSPRPYGSGTFTARQRRMLSQVCQAALRSHSGRCADAARFAALRNITRNSPTLLRFRSWIVGIYAFIVASLARRPRLSRPL